MGLRWGQALRSDISFEKCHFVKPDPLFFKGGTIKFLARGYLTPFLEFKMSSNLPYKRVLLKISGEKLMGTETFGVSQQACKDVAKALITLQLQGIQVALVAGGGNIFRGVQAEALGLQQSAADSIGMLATMINGVALCEALTVLGHPARVMTALDCPRVAESYSWHKAIQYLEQGKIVIFVGGTGNPYFTTDTAAALRACEIGADVLLKGTKVDGVYDKDPVKYKDAVRFDTITYSQVLAKKLAVMDATAIALCREHNIPVIVFKMSPDLPLADVLKNQRGTLVTPD